ncbi:metalloregulator ArsR/SmtB family transcription factor [Alphaproteobacteria bacterium]|nr:metalloregulator ArsR/SmtB family transcription factor [Alphaproteobacteria bacterium]
MQAILNALRAAGEPTRMRILSVLSSGELTVTELTYILRQSQPRISRHLKLLADAGLIERHPEASWVFYRLVQARGFMEFFGQLLDALPSDDPTLMGDLARLTHVRRERTDRADAYFSANAVDWEDIRSRHLPEKDIEASISKLLPKKTFGNLVDLGTGTGRMLELFGSLAHKATGFDLNPDMLTLARSRLQTLGYANCFVQQGDATQIPFANEEADVVIIHQVLHFLDNPAMAIGEAARVLAPNGKLVVVDFAPHDMENLREEHAHRRLGFEAKEVQGWMVDVGLTPETIENLGDDQDKSNLTVSIWSGSKRKRNTK